MEIHYVYPGGLSLPKDYSRELRRAESVSTRHDLKKTRVALELEEEKKFPQYVLYSLGHELDTHTDPEGRGTETQELEIC